MTSHQNSADVAAEVLAPDDDALPAAPADMPPCPKHGRTLEPVRSVGPKAGTICYACPLCTQEAIARQRDAEISGHADDVARASHARRQAELEQRIGAAGIPARYRALSFDTFPDDVQKKPSVHLARNYANRWAAMRAKGVSILLIGPTGTGKTGLACAIGNHLLQQHGATVLFMSAYAAVRHQRDTWGRKGKTEREALDDLLSVDLLILDEVGASVGSDAELAMLFEVINGRYAAQKPQILLSNLPIDDFEHAGERRPGLRTFLGARVLERFRDDGSFVLTLPGASLRGPRPQRDTTEARP